MKVLHLCDHPPYGGAFEAAQSIADLVGGPVFRSQKPGKAVQAGATICGYCLPAEKAQIRRVIKQHDPEIVHLHNFKEFGTAAIAAAKAQNVPVVWSCYDYWPLCPRDSLHDDDCRPDECRLTCYNPIGVRLPTIAKLPMLGRQTRMRKWMGQLDAIIALSSHSQQLLFDGGIGLPKGEQTTTHVIPLPITLPKVSVEKDRNLVAFVGGQPMIKGGGVFQAAEKLVRAQRPEVRFQVIHASSRQEALESIAAAQVLVVADLWMNPGPVVIVEAACLGTNIVASDVGGIRETAERYTNAGFAPPGQPQAFAEEILRALDIDAEPSRGPDLPEIKKTLLEVYACAIKRASSQ
ncbi:MAG: glycosyltransferase [Candidatus Latescibacterota bacterium]|nr:glycosyltransferase [Candidatus Latescibacterota bacterium]